MFAYRSFEYANCARVACDFLKMFSAYNLDRETTICWFSFIFI